MGTMNMDASAAARHRQKDRFNRYSHEVIELPRPDQTSGLPLMTALSSRSSIRGFAPIALSLATLGGLLWAADGVNRPIGGDRTAPLPCAFNGIDIYASLPNGLYRYDAQDHQLLLKTPHDIRARTGYLEFAGEAPLDLVYVVQSTRLLDVTPQLRERLAAVTAGTIAQNVALYCASAGLSNVIRGWIDQLTIAEALRLNEDELPILAQTVGLPAL